MAPAGTISLDTLLLCNTGLSFGVGWAAGVVCGVTGAVFISAGANVGTDVAGCAASDVVSIVFSEVAQDTTLISALHNKILKT